MFFFYLFASISSLSVSFLILSSENTSHYFQNIYLFPLTFFILNILSFKIYNNYKVYQINMVVLILLYFKFTVTPWIMYLSNFVSIIEINDYRLISESIFLSIYEFFFIFLLINFYRMPYKKVLYERELGINFFMLKKNGFWIIFLLFFFLILTYILNTSVNENVIKTIFDKNLTINLKDNINLNALNFFSRFSFTLFNVVYPIFVFILSITLFHKLKNNYKESIFQLILLVLILSINLIFINTSTSKFQIFIYLIAYFLIILNYFHRLIKLSLIIFSLISLLGLYQIYNFKSDIFLFEDNNSIEVLSKMTQAYMPNITNLAAGLNLEATLSEKINSILGDLYKTIPFRSTLFGLSIGRDFGYYWNSENTGYLLDHQIAANLSYGVFYFGNILSPIFSIIMIYFALYFQKIMLSSKSIFEFSIYCLLSVQLVFSVFLYNYNTFLTRYFVFFLPLIIIIKILKKSYYDKNI